MTKENNLKEQFKQAILSTAKVISDDYKIKIDKKNKITAIKEKPKKFVSNYAITGLYFYDSCVVDIPFELDIDPTFVSIDRIPNINKVDLQFIKDNQRVDFFYIQNMYII